MAFEKLIKKQDGIQGEYISIYGIEFFTEHNLMIVQFNVYYSKTSKDAGESPIFDFIKRFEDFPLSKMESKNPLSALYDEVKLNLKNSLPYDLTGALNV